MIFGTCGRLSTAFVVEGRRSACVAKLTSGSGNILMEAGKLIGTFMILHVIKSPSYAGTNGRCQLISVSVQYFPVSNGSLKVGSGTISVLIRDNIQLQ